MDALFGARGAQALAAALDKIATLTRLDLGRNDIGARSKGGLALAATLDSNAARCSP
jgi:hypothetical protein